MGSDIECRRERRRERRAYVSLLQERPLARLVAARQPRRERLDVWIEPDHDTLAERSPILLPRDHAAASRHDLCANQPVSRVSSRHRVDGVQVVIQP